MGVMRPRLTNAVTVARRNLTARRERADAVAGVGFGGRPLGERRPSNDGGKSHRSDQLLHDTSCLLSSDLSLDGIADVHISHVPPKTRVTDATGGQPSVFSLPLNLPKRRRQVLGAELNCSELRRGSADPKRPDVAKNSHDRGLERDDFSSNRHPALDYCWSMIFSENRYPLFGIML